MPRLIWFRDGGGHARAQLSPNAQQSTHHVPRQHLFASIDRNSGKGLVHFCRAWWRRFGVRDLRRIEPIRDEED
jgi:hypothetical protein